MNKTKQDWVITSLGKVVRRDKVKPKDIVPDEIKWHEEDIPMSVPNSFGTKEIAYNVRDNVIDFCPNAFLATEETPKKPGPKPKGKVVEQDEFRELIRQQLMDRMDKFWANWETLKAVDKCAYYTKLLLFAYSKAPNERVLDPLTAKNRKDESKRAAAAEAIHNGLPATADTNFEE